MSPSVAKLLNDLRHDGVSIWLEGEQLRYMARAGALSGTRKEQLRALKDQIVLFLRDESIERRSPVLSAKGTTGLLPLSFAQRAFVAYYDQLPNPSLQTALCVRKVPHSIDTDVLFRSFCATMMRHSTLRARYVRTFDGQLRISIADSPDLDFRVLDVSGYSTSAREERIAGIISAVGSLRFNLFSGPLIRVRTLKIAEDEHLIVVAIHHSVCDAWSFAILSRELQAHYSAILSSRPTNLPELPVQYSDYVQWLDEWLTSEAGEEHLAYWRRTFQGASRPFWLPREYEFRPVHSTVPLQSSFVLEKEDVDRLRALARESRDTLYILALTGFVLLLSRWRGTKDAFVKVVHFGRHRTELVGLIGCLADCVVLRVDMTGATKFGDALRQVRKANLEAMGHIQVPYWKVKEELLRLSKEEALLDIHFNFSSTQEPQESTDSADSTSGALEFAPIPENANPLQPLGLGDTLEESSGIILKVDILESASRLSCAVRFIGNCISGRTITSFIMEFEHLLCALARTGGIAKLDKI